MAKIKTFISIAVITLFSGLQIYISLAKIQKTQWLPNNLQVIDNGGIVVVRNTYSQGFLINIAPYQDFVYFKDPNLGKTSLKSAFISAQNKPWLNKFLTLILNSTEWIWKLNNPELIYEYKLTYQSRAIKILRTVQSQNEIEKIGQVIQFCQTCVAINKVPMGKVLIQNTVDGASVYLVVPKNSKVNSYPGNIIEFVTPVGIPQEIQFESL